MGGTRTAYCYWSEPKRHRKRHEKRHRAANICMKTTYVSPSCSFSPGAPGALNLDLQRRRWARQIPIALPGTVADCSLPAGVDNTTRRNRLLKPQIYARPQRQEPSPITIGAAQWYGGAIGHGMTKGTGMAPFAWAGVDAGLTWKDASTISTNCIVLAKGQRKF